MRTIGVIRKRSSRSASCTRARVCGGRAATRHHEGCRRRTRRLLRAAQPRPRPSRLPVLARESLSLSERLAVESFGRDQALRQQSQTPLALLLREGWLVCGWGCALTGLHNDSGYRPTSTNLPAIGPSTFVRASETQ